MVSLFSRRALLAMSVMMAGVFAVSILGSAAYAQDGRIRFKIKLHVPTKTLDAPKGRAKYVQRAEGRKKLNVEVEHIVGSTNIEVFVDGGSVGTAALTGGAVEIELDTKKGDTVPTMTESSLVEVFDADTNAKLLTSA